MAELAGGDLESASAREAYSRHQGIERPSQRIIDGFPGEHSALRPIHIVPMLQRRAAEPQYEPRPLLLVPPGHEVSRARCPVIGAQVQRHSRQHARHGPASDPFLGERLIVKDRGAELG